jgi:hypothetical protein
VPERHAAPSPASDYPIEATGALKLLQKSPMGEASKWVEIVSFD